MPLGCTISLTVVTVHAGKTLKENDAEEIADAIRTVRVFRQKFALEDAIGSHTCSLEANMRVTNGIHLGCPLLLPVGTVNSVQTLKDETR
jgi:hypothetical protein